MFFESPRHYKCKVVEPREYTQTNQAISNYMSLCSRAPEYHSGHGEQRPSGGVTSMATANTLAVVPPEPAPRKIRNNHLTGVQQSSQLFAHHHHPHSQLHNHISVPTTLTRQKPILIDRRKEVRNLMNNQNNHITPKSLSSGFKITANSNSNNNNKIETLNHAQNASEDTNESSSEDDTEDSTDNKLQDKPKVSYEIQTHFLKCFQKNSLEC